MAHTLQALTLHLECTRGLEMHFTYGKIGEHLEQGDILRKSDELSELLERVHPHYHVSSSYHYFLVLTQTCDLVRRSAKSNCKSRYITLAGVRPLDLAVLREVEKYQKNDFERHANVCNQNKKQGIEQFVERTLNNNEPTLFYLHEEPSLGINQPMCAFLRLSIAIRAHEHYELCMNSRVAALTEPFRAKLGWLVGNIYSRVGTEDWVPKVASKEDFRAKIDTIVDCACTWVDGKKLSQAKETARKNGTDIKSSSPEDLRKLISDQTIETNAEIVRDIIRQTLSNRSLLSDNALDEKTIETVIRSLQSNGRFNKAIGN